MITIGFSPEKKVHFQHFPSELLEAKDYSHNLFLRYSVSTSQKSIELDILTGILRRKGIKFQDVRIALSVELAAFKDISQIDEVIETTRREAQLPQKEFNFPIDARTRIQDAFREETQSKQSSTIGP